MLLCLRQSYRANHRVQTTAYTPPFVPRCGFR